LLVHVVARELRAAIFNGELAPGSPIRQEAVAKQFGTSRIPVREALRQLESEGLVTVRPNSGARVAVLDFDWCLETYMIRERLEPLLFGESVERVTPEQIDVVAEAAARIEAVAGDHAVWLEADRRFHIACYAGATLPRVMEMVVGYWNTTQQYRRVLLRTFTDEDFSSVHAEHRVMVDLMRTHQRRGAEEVVRLHIERSRLRLAANRSLFDR
jgi:DNA-binding GntR family transcriptional regulator